jgi:hypothetical protein
MTDLTEFLAASRLEDLVSQLLPSKAACGSKTSDHQLSNHTVEMLSPSVKEDVIRYFIFYFIFVFRL